MGQTVVQTLLSIFTYFIWLMPEISFGLLLKFHLQNGLLGVKEGAQLSISKRPAKQAWASEFRS